jgi:hypothetical protein
MKALRTRCIVMLALAVLAPACGSTSDDSESTSENKNAPLTPVTSIDFENYPTGPLGAPWSVSQTGASAIGIATTADHGKVFALHGSGTSGDFLTAAFPLTAAVRPQRPRGSIVLTASNAATSDPTCGRSPSSAPALFALSGAGSSLGARRIRLQRLPGSTTLVANTAGAGDVSCGTLASGAWSTVELFVHTQRSPHTFDVRINGAATACTRSTTEMSAPFTSVSVMDASNAGFGGDVDFDDILAKASTESTCESR